MAALRSLFVVSAPSGAGKRTILDKVFAEDDALAYVVSATTRTPRANEVEGRNYYFMSVDEFQSRIDADAFVEWAEVHGHLYGTLRDELAQRLASGKDVVLELDVQGMRQVQAARPDAVTVFVMAPSMAELERRLRERGANDSEDMALRLANARQEVAVRYEFEYIVVNDELARAVEDMRAIVRAARCRSIKQPEEREAE